MNVVIPILGLTTHGGNRVLIQIANELVRSGHECTIVTSWASADCPFSVDPRVAIERRGPRTAHKLLRWLYLLTILTWRMRGADAVLANHFLTAIPARLAVFAWKTRVLYLVQGIEYRAYAAPWSNITEGLCRRTWRTGTLIAANPYLDDELRRLGASPAFVLRLGVDEAFLTTPVADDERKLFDVVCMLRREHYKRADRLLEITRELMRLGRTVLCICPDAELAASHQASFTQIARPDSDQALIALYDSAKIFLLTSDHEGFALPPLECMARGLPPVMFPCGGPSVYARDGENCVVVGDASTDTAVTEIVSLLADVSRYARLSERARATARGYAMSPAVKALMPVLLGEGYPSDRKSVV